MLQSRRKPNSVRRRPAGPGYGVTTIPLVPALLTGSSNRPGGVRPANAPAKRAVASAKTVGRAVLNASLFGLAPCGVLPATRVATSAVRSYRTFSPLLRLRPFGLRRTGLIGLSAEARRSARRRSGIFSVPLSFELPRPGVTRRTALRSSDFPPAYALGASAGKPAWARREGRRSSSVTAALQVYRTRRSKCVRSKSNSNSQLPTPKVTGHTSRNPTSVGRWKLEVGS